MPLLNTRPFKYLLMATFTLLCLCFAFSAQAAPAESALKSMELQMFGQNYASEPLENRVERLENAFHVKPGPGDSLSYRITTLCAMQQSKVTSEGQNAAIAAYNAGIDEEAKKNDAQAIADFEQAIQDNPGLVQAYNNWANILERQAHYEQAVEIYERALQYAPQEPLLHRNLGVMYERVGRVEDAISEYKEYLGLVNRPDPPIQSIVRNYDENHAKGMQANDYVMFASNASDGRKLIWPENMIPIPVFIEAADSNQMVLVPIVEECFSEWQLATKGRLRFKEVGNPQAAKIRIVLRPGPLTDPDRDVAHTQYDVNFDSVQALQALHMLITVNTGLPNMEISPQDRFIQVHRLVLHELGHAIGIWGHSLDPGDIMYTHPIVSKLSNRDVLTIQKLYGITR